MTAQAPYRTALILGAGDGLGASLGRVFHRDGGMRVVLAARDTAKLGPVCAEIGAAAFRCDATDAAQVATLFEAATRHLGAAPEVVVYNASRRVRGAFVDVDAGEVARAIAVSAMGGFHLAQQAARHMVPAGRGAILFTGASASVKGYPQSAAFAMGKFALRGLAQSLARELGPLGIHVGHVVIDGSIRRLQNPPGDSATAADAQLDPMAIAASYLYLLAQPRSAWSWEVELRPWVERF